MIVPLFAAIFYPLIISAADLQRPLDSPIEYPPPLSDNVQSVNPKLQIILVNFNQDANGNPLDCAEEFVKVLKKKNSYYISNIEEYHTLIWKVIEKNLLRSLLAKSEQQLRGLRYLLNLLREPRSLIRRIFHLPPEKMLYFWYLYDPSNYDYFFLANPEVNLLADFGTDLRLAKNAVLAIKIARRKDPKFHTCQVELDQMLEKIQEEIVFFNIEQLQSKMARIELKLSKLVQAE
jgi:hypothetical protein